METAIDSDGDVLPLMAPPEERPPFRGTATILLQALALGGAVDGLWLGQSGKMGIGFSLLLGTFAVVLVGLALRERTPIRWRNGIILLAPLIFFAVMVSVRDNGFLTFLNATAALGLTVLLCGFLAAGRVETTGFAELWKTPWRVTLGSLHRPAPLVADSVGETIASPERRQKAYPLLRGLLLTTPILLVFGLLLCSADAMFERMLSSIATWLLPTDIERVVWHIGVVIGSAWLLAGAIVHALTRRDTETVLSHKEPPLGFVETMTVFSSVCGVFIAFIAIQFTYLFGGHTRVQTVPGLTYSEYAHRGFGELVTVALLTLLLVNGLRTITRRQGTGQTLAFNTLGTLLVALTLILLASAYQRMAVYESAYGATETRLYVDVFLFWLGAALVWFAATLWTVGGATRFAFGVFACAIGFLTTLDVINPDVIIARTNLARAQANRRLDSWTLYRLSADAIPELIAAHDALPEGDQNRRLLSALMRQHLDQMQDPAAVSWTGANSARNRAYRLLTEHIASLPNAAQADRIITGQPFPER